MSCIWAFIGNCGNHRMDVKGDSQVPRSMRDRVPMLFHGAEQAVGAEIFL